MSQIIYIDSRTACNGSCETAYGCDCCTTRMPAEASTEVGADQDDLPREPMTWTDRVLLACAFGGCLYFFGSLAHRAVSHLFSLF